MEFSITINFMIAKNGIGECIETLRMYAGLGFRRLDALFCAADLSGTVLMEDGFMEHMRAIKREADALGVTFVQSHLPFCNVADQTQGGDPAFREAMRRAVISAGILGVRYVAAHPWTPAFYPDAKKVNTEYYAPFLELAAENGLGIAFENLFDGCYDTKRAFGAEAAELAGFTDSLTDRGYDAGICWDFGHGNIMYPKQTQSAQLSFLGKRLKMTHVHDNDGRADAHLPPFYGNADWAANVRALKEMDYAGAFNFEVTPKAYTRTVSLRKSELGYLKTLGEYLITLV